MKAVKLQLKLVPVLLTLLVILLVVVIFMFRQVPGNEIVIQGDMQRKNSYLEGKKVYFGRQETKEFLDSAIVRDGKFRLTVKTGADFVPFEATLLYATGNPAYPYWMLGFKNPYRSKTFMSNFYADKGTMDLVVDTSSSYRKKEVIAFRILNINKQTEAAFRMLAFQPAGGAGKDAATSNAKIIGMFPSSMYLLKQLDWQKKSLGDAEVSTLLSEFDKSVHQTPLYRRLVKHVSFQNKTGNAFPSEITCFTPDLRPATKLLDHEKYNLVVFWASWCAPCRHEIPQLRQLFSAHADKVNIVSVSIDTKEHAWKRAMEQEQMPWQQMLLRRDNSFVKFDKTYGLNTIPLWLLFDKDGTFMASHTGLEQGEAAVNAKVASLITTQ
ncbi:TlpA disulfide reductase family protein [Dyadobacter sandarakinus]|uniref:TlpA family protein disulfide reductase n=1 Tax=Dyadobacter sandarakinus TaxID=2747268 RepID=A0ABX7I6T0_9BACT|nr:TlpA disulfide reductase family protein [Dyadobacter sandarakinus]QRR00681.1 TlpA family protein disulfide reductase [Dyadobacter sandarakinus]